MTGQRECVQCGAPFDDADGPGWGVCLDHRVRLVPRDRNLVDVVEVGSGDVIDSGLSEQRAREIYADALSG